MDSSPIFHEAAVQDALDRLGSADEPNLDRAYQRQLSLQARSATAASSPRPSLIAVTLQHLRSALRPLPALPIAALVVLTCSLFTSPVQSLASQFLTIFRVQDFAPLALPGTGNGALGQQLPDLTMFGDMQPAAPPAVQMQRMSDLAAASSAVGFGVRLPSALPQGFPEQPTQVDVTPAQSVTFTFRVAKAQTYLQSIGRQDVSLPARFDGASLRLTVPSAVFLSFASPDSSTGDASAALEQCCLFRPRSGPQGGPQAGSAAPRRSASNPGAIGEGRQRSIEQLASAGVTVFELQTPTLDASGVSFDDLRNFLLSLPGLPPDTAAQLRALPDPSSTLPIPIPQGVGAQKVQVNGAPGVLLADTANRIAGGIVWSSQGRLYGVVGPLDSSQLLDIAGSMGG